MNREIKELLDNIDIWYKENDLDYTRWFGLEELKQLKDYITNLQKENERLRKVLNCKEYFTKLMPYRTEFVLLTKADYDRQEKNIEEENIDLKQRIDNAIEYIKTCNPDVDLNSMFLNESYISNYGANELLKILGGDE